MQELSGRDGCEDISFHWTWEFVKYVIKNISAIYMACYNEMVTSDQSVQRPGVQHLVFKKHSLINLTLTLRLIT